MKSKMKLPEGFFLSAVNCGLKQKELDLGLIYIPEFSKAVGFFTKNVNLSYSVLLSKRNINKNIKAILANSGSANCYSHKNGLRDTEEIASKLGKYLDTKKENILVASTGIIGKKLSKSKVINAMPRLINNLSKKTNDFSYSILTTDTFAKTSYSECFIGKERASISGFAKGAGMISPDLATMLAFILTDVDLDDKTFKKIAKEAVEESFNSITVDGCMSTNDTVFFVSSKKYSIKNKIQLVKFSQQLKSVCLDLAKKIVRDGEGASKFVEINIKGAKSKPQAKRAGLSLANSNLFKSAMYGANSNWGRIVSAFGQAGIKVNEEIVIKASSLKKRDIKISIDLKQGNADWVVYTSDLSPKYVKINATLS